MNDARCVKCGTMLSHRESEMCLACQALAPATGSLELITKESALKAIEAELLKGSENGFYGGANPNHDGLMVAKEAIQSLPPVADERVEKLIECLRWYAGNRTPESRLNDNGDKAERLLSELNQGKV